jgi:hypothetical protein
VRTYPRESEGLFETGKRYTFRTMALEAGLVRLFKLELVLRGSAAAGVARPGAASHLQGLQALRTTPLRLDLEKQCTLLHTSD